MKIYLDKKEANKFLDVFGGLNMSINDIRKELKPSGSTIEFINNDTNMLIEINKDFVLAELKTYERYLPIIIPQAKALVSGINSMIADMSSRMYAALRKKEKEDKENEFLQF